MTSSFCMCSDQATNCYFVLTGSFSFTDLFLFLCGTLFFKRVLRLFLLFRFSLVFTLRHDYTSLYGAYTGSIQRPYKKATENFTEEQILGLFRFDRFSVGISCIGISRFCCFTSFPGF